MLEPWNISSGKWPDKVLYLVFDALSFRARVKFKTVCRHWYNVQLHEKYVNRDKIVCRGLWATDRTMETLHTFNVGRLRNLEFQCFDLLVEHYNRIFWPIRGSHIRELRFVNCTMDEDTFELMVLNCSQLVSLYWDERGNGSQICSGQFLDSLIERSVYHPALLVFETSKAVSVQWVLKFRQIFPFAKRMSYFLEPSSPSDEQNVLPSEARQTRSMSHRVVDEELSLNLPEISEEKLTLKYHELSNTFLTNSLSTAVNLESLVEIEINVGTTLKAPHQVALLQIVAKQSFLRKMTFVSGPEMNTVFAGTLLRTLLDKCEGLQWLFIQMGGADELIIDAYLFEDIKHSKLRYLRLSCPIIQFDSIFYIPPSEEEEYVNRHLRFLAVKSEIDSVSCHILLKNFTNLDGLDLEGRLDVGTNTLLKYITKYNRQINSLRLVNILKPVPDEERPQKTSVKTKINESVEFFNLLALLKNLKYLTLLFHKELRVEGLVDDFQLPKLEYLRAKIENGSEKFFDALLNAFGQSKPLRAASFVYSKLEIPFKTWLKFCSQFKHLEYLGVVGSANGVPQKMFTMSERDELFARCPSLRVVAQTPVALGSATDEAKISYIDDKWDNKIGTYHTPGTNFSYSINSRDLEHNAVDWMVF